MIYIGTSGYSFPDWVGKVYPSEIDQRSMLRYYAFVWKFNVVELNFTYYRMPALKTVVGILRKTPSDFFFTVKLPQPVTHEIWRKGDTEELSRILNHFTNALVPMKNEGRLKCILVQFPRSFVKSRQNMDYTLVLRDFLVSHAPMAVEFRHDSWVSNETYDFLKEHSISHVVADEPKLDRLYPYVAVHTASPAYFRFHGRNVRWFEAQGSKRYDYLYDRKELEEFAEDVKKMAEKGDVYVFFNNCYNGQAVTNALEFRKLLGEV